jgi:hypothetical protein
MKTRTEWRRNERRLHNKDPLPRGSAGGSAHLSKPEAQAGVSRLVWLFSEIWTPNAPSYPQLL